MLLLFAFVIIVLALLEAFAGFVFLAFDKLHALSCKARERRSAGHLLLVYHPRQLA